MPAPHSKSSSYCLLGTTRTSRWPDLIKMHIALRKGNGDTGLAEFAVDSLVQFVQHRYPVIDTVDKDPQFEIETVVTETQKNGLRFRVLKDQRVGFGGLEQQLFSQFGIGSIGDADREF